VPTVVLANLILDEIVVPELLQWNCTPEKLADALLPLLDDTAERRRQLEAFARLDDILEIGRAAPSERAAELICATIEGRRTDA
jgi:lipid-A-disaccharide synthase